MVDTFTKTERSRIMRLVKGKDTTPEKKVRSLIHSLGYRYRLHRKDLPGSPDIVFPKRRKVIFVNGCFWHAHNCKRFKLPQDHRGYWKDKFQRNKARDRRNIMELKKTGWDALTIWECDLKDLNAIKKKVVRFLG